MNRSFNTQRNLTKFSTLIINLYYHRCYLFNFWTFRYFLNRSMQKSVTYDIMSLTMVFTEEDRVLIKLLRQNKG